MSKGNQGFAAMPAEHQRALASRGGKAAHEKGTAHEWTAEEARAAGRKGGLATHARRRMQRASSVDVGADVPNGGAT